MSRHLAGETDWVTYYKYLQNFPLIFECSGTWPGRLSRSCAFRLSCCSSQPLAEVPWKMRGRQFFFIILIRFRGGGEAERGTEDLTKLARCSRKSDTQDQRGEDKKLDYLIYRSLPRIYRYQKFQLGKGSGYQDKDQDISEISIRKNGWLYVWRQAWPAWWFLSREDGPSRKTSAFQGSQWRRGIRCESSFVKRTDQTILLSIEN